MKSKGKGRFKENIRGNEEKKLVETIDLLNKENGVGSPYKDQPRGNDGE